MPDVICSKVERPSFTSLVGIRHVPERHLFTADMVRSLADCAKLLEQ